MKRKKASSNVHPALLDAGRKLPDYKALLGLGAGLLAGGMSPDAWAKMEAARKRIEELERRNYREALIANWQGRASMVSIGWRREHFPIIVPWDKPKVYRDRVCHDTAS